MKNHIDDNLKIMRSILAYGNESDIAEEKKLRFLDQKRRYNAKEFAEGEQFFYERHSFDEATEEQKNNINFVRGFKKALRTQQILDSDCCKKKK